MTETVNRLTIYLLLASVCEKPALWHREFHYPRRQRSIMSRILRSLCHDVCVCGCGLWVCMLSW